MTTSANTIASQHCIEPLNCGYAVHFRLSRYNQRQGHEQLQADPM